MKENKHDWSTFSLKIPIKATIKRIYDFWTIQEHIETFFLEYAYFYINENRRNVNDYMVMGDTYEWKWYGSDIVAKGEILYANGKDRLEFSFFGCKVIIQIYTFEGENIVKLIQEDIPLDEQSIINNNVGCTRGWTFYLTNLKSILEGGIDLRNKNEKLGDVVNT